LNNYPPQPQLPAPGGYNPFNPYSGYDPNADYVPWLPGRQGPRFLPIAIIVAAILICSCCSFLAGTVFGIELPGLLQPSNSGQQNPGQQPQQEPTQEEPPPGSFMWQVTHVNA
jgi:hypothetical protein